MIFTYTDPHFQLNPTQLTLVTDGPLELAKVQQIRLCELLSPNFYCFNGIFETLILSHRMFENSDKLI